MTISYSFLFILLLATLVVGLVLGLVFGMNCSDTRDDE